MTLRAKAEWLAAMASSSPTLSRVTGVLSDLRLPQPVLLPVIRALARVYGIDLAEAVEPPGGYPSFDAFFTRRLVAGRRPVANGHREVASPCDSRVSVIGPMPENGRLEQIKGSSYSVAALLGSEEDARPFASGVQATLYLSPAMYHRVHSPVDGRVCAWRYVPGRLFTVNALGVRSIPGLFARNERVVVSIDSEQHGKVALVMVGAANVGRMSLAFADLVTNQGVRVPQRSTPETPVVLRRGDELGTFNLGSTVVLLVADPALAAVPNVGERLLMGQALWRSSK